MSQASHAIVEVNLPGGAYQVQVGADALKGVASTTRTRIGSKATRAFLIVDTGVPTSFVDALVNDLASHGLVATVSQVTPSEKMKSIETYQQLLVQIAASGHTRVDPVIALGGGVVGDLAGFVAASFQRGVPVVQCPTTLLSMVDASVGGKTGFNLTVPNETSEPTIYKNLVGAFHQPTHVVADMAVLESLDARYRRAGLAECVKHGMICKTVGQGRHDGLMDWMIEHLNGIKAFELATIEELVARNVSLKAAVVVSDEHESTDAKVGGRMLLNFGHTFGHAIETIAGLSPDRNDPGLAPLHHGEAVALGMVAACRAGQRAGLCDVAIGDELVAMLESIGLPVCVDGLPSNDELLDRMGRDKKAAGGELRVILPIGRGQCQIVTGPDAQVLAAGFDSIRS